MIEGLAGLLYSGATTVLVFLVLLSFIVFVHELGHFLVARWCGVTVTTFSIGFGQEIAGFNDRYGTRWRFAAIPLGGYVKFLDDTNAASGGAGREVTPEEQAGAFHTKPVWQRAAVVAAGPLANFILAILIYAMLNMTVGVRTLPPKIGEVVPGMPGEQAGLRAGDLITSIDGWKVEGYEEATRLIGAASGRAILIEVDRAGEDLSFTVLPQTIEQKVDLGLTVRLGDIGIRYEVLPQVGDVLADSPAARAGLMTGDLILAIDGKPIRRFDDVVEAVAPSAGRALLFKIEREGKERELTITPALTQGVGRDGKPLEQGRIGMRPAILPQAVSAPEAFRLAVRETYAGIVQTVMVLGDIFAGRQSADQVGGPILMAQVTGKAMEHGVISLLILTAALSANIGFLNLLPIPVLDGGHLMFYAIEALRRKPLHKRVQDFGFQIGLALVLMLMVFVNINDILRFGRWAAERIGSL